GEYLRVKLYASRGDIDQTAPGTMVNLYAGRVRCGKLSDVKVTDLSPEGRAWVERMEPLWRRAHEIVQQHPDIDVGDVFHVLRNLERSPEERLHRALTYGRNRPYGG
ncbi:MAG TPA: hypothetical protein VGP93_21200, partial [Polyangiaceae bacterium]|nr:hypothetical protein [Polyangiaceae bacterium]